MASLTANAAPTISREAFTYLADHIYRHSRIRIGPDKEQLLVSRVIKRLRHLRLSSFEEYCELLRSPASAVETHHLVDVISTNHTHFFREKEHFDYLHSSIVPEWLGSGGRQSRPLRIWSAACSSGEEPYTLGMVLAEFARQRAAFHWQIDASDICTRILERAEAGIYETEKMSLPSPELLPRYFQKGVGRNEGNCRVKSTLRERITFHHLNLFQATYPLTAGHDVIFCRNVMIYFDQPSIHTLVNRLAASLPSGGHLIVGLSESLLNIDHPLKQVRPGIYRKA